MKATISAIITWLFFLLVSGHPGVALVCALFIGAPIFIGVYFVCGIVEEIHRLH